MAIVGASICLTRPDKGLDPEYTIADAAPGLPAGQKAALGDTPCHGDVFHTQHQCETLANIWTRIASGTRSRRQKLEAGLKRARRCNRG
jgi:hypothetical protein